MGGHRLTLRESLIIRKFDEEGRALALAPSPLSPAEVLAITPVTRVRAGQDTRIAAR